MLRMAFGLWAVGIVGVAGLVQAEERSAGLVVLATTPMGRSLQADFETTISIHFDQAVDRNSVAEGKSFWAFGRWSGTAIGPLTFSDDDRTVTMTPGRPFSAGEQVMVLVSNAVQGVDGSTLRRGGYSFQFWIRTKPSNGTFTKIGQLTTRTDPFFRSRAYGGIASDLDGDGWLDITVINEDTADLRVFMNRADGSGRYNPFVLPTYPVGNRASPSEPADFDRDGITDICVANINDNTVSVLLGRGDGSFFPQQSIPVGWAPRGIAVLDVDGDGDVDIVNTNADGSNMSLLINDGVGVFDEATFFNTGGRGEWALAAADMNEDGRLDLVIGARASRNIWVLSNNGNGTFTNLSRQDAGGSVWMLVCGDVNGDGHEDVAAVNSSHNNGAILLGDGMGGLGPPTIYPTDRFPLATDLGDLNGDGDLDWVTSSFSGDWLRFSNDGFGRFAFAEEYPAPRAASCALLMDANNDGRLDMSLIDELADLVILYRNTLPRAPAGAHFTVDTGVSD